MKHPDISMDVVGIFQRGEKKSSEKMLIIKLVTCIYVIMNMIKRHVNLVMAAVLNCYSF